MGKHPARAMYDELDDALTSMTRQLRSAIAADTQPLDADGGASRWARRVSADLAAVLLDTVGLAATIEWHLRQYQKCTGILCELTVRSAGGCDLPEGHAATIFDVYSEALSSVARHAGASRVAIALTVTPREVTMVVSDDGIGLRSDACAADASAMAAMRTTVSVSLPMAPAAVNVVAAREDAGRARA